MRRSNPIFLTPTERHQLEYWSSNEKSNPRRARRAVIILHLAAKHSVEETVMILHTSPTVVYKWRDRFLHYKLDGISHDAPKPGRGIRMQSIKADDFCNQIDAIRFNGQSTPTILDLAEANDLSVSGAYRITSRYGVPFINLKRSIIQEPRIHELSDIIGFFFCNNLKILAFLFEYRDELIKYDVRHRGTEIPSEHTLKFFHQRSKELLDASNNVMERAILKKKNNRAYIEALYFLNLIERKTKSDRPILLFMSPSTVETQKYITLWLDKHPRFQILVSSSDSDWSAEVQNIIDSFKNRYKRIIGLQLDHLCSCLDEQIGLFHGCSSYFSAIIPYI